MLYLPLLDYIVWIRTRETSTLQQIHNFCFPAKAYNLINNGLYRVIIYCSMNT